MHAHDGVKFYGKEKVADGPGGVAPGIAELRAHGYEGGAVATGLVQAGFVVLVHDVFPWGSRRVPWPELPDRARSAGFTAYPPGPDTPDIRRRRYEAAAREHEHGLAKVAALTGTSLAGTVVAEDLRALDVLLATDGVDPNRVAAAGFSGGGARVAHLLACSTRLRAGAITAMMSTFADVADGRADDTTWLMITPGLPAICDWPDVAGSAAPRPLLVQFASGDPHFSRPGMEHAETLLRRAYDGSDALTTQWFAGGHRFSARMQAAAAAWLARTV
jgi:predicted esterase